jgi:hypothetical protein
MEVRGIDSRRPFDDDSEEGQLLLSETDVRGLMLKNEKQGD